MDIGGLINSAFDIDSKIGLDTVNGKKKRKKLAKENKDEMNLFKDSDDPDYEITKENIMGRRNTKKTDMPGKQHP